jgi:ribonuclease T2
MTIACYGAGIAMAVAAVAPLPALAQAYRCSVPGEIARPRPDGPTTQQPRRVVPTRGYTLALTWNPQYCRENGDRQSARFQCGADNRFGFTLHGLWPDGDGVNRWPQYCSAAPLLSEQVIRRNLCATPSAQLLQHEYAKHGTCMNVTPAAYFNQASGLYGRVRYPDMEALSRRRGLTVGAFAQAFARVNRGLTPDMFRVTANRQGWLDEVWLCLDTRLRRTRCPAHQRSASANTPLKIWRGRR